MLWGSIAFLIVLGVLVKFAFPTLKKTMADRTEKIRSDLDGAASAKAQAEEELYSLVTLESADFVFHDARWQTMPFARSNSAQPFRQGPGA